jgi:hypothetical protein
VKRKKWRIEIDNDRCPYRRMKFLKQITYRCGNFNHPLYFRRYLLNEPQCREKNCPLRTQTEVNRPQNESAPNKGVNVPNKGTV